MFCTSCAGMGEIRGNGMLMEDCRICSGEGQIDDKSPEKSEISEKSCIPIDKRSKAYKEAISDIMALNPDITRDEAVKMFNSAYDKA